jgi:hypothetical protein
VIALKLIPVTLFMLIAQLFNLLQAASKECRDGDGSFGFGFLHEFSRKLRGNSLSP